MYSKSIILTETLLKYFSLVEAYTTITREREIPLELSSTILRLQKPNQTSSLTIL